MTSNFGDFQNGVYGEALRGVSSRYPFDFASIERKASETLPEAPHPEFPLTLDLRRPTGLG
jgi:hypothetical protein